MAYEPLEKVEDEIRKTLAGEKANQMINETFQRLSAKMREYSSARGEYEAARKTNPNLEEPEPLDLPALASAEGLEAKETDLVSADELYADTDLGKSFNDDIPDRRSLTAIGKFPFRRSALPIDCSIPNRPKTTRATATYRGKSRKRPRGCPSLTRSAKKSFGR